jgi:hypothetical protein
MDTMFLVGGQKNQAPINTLGKAFIDQVHFVIVDFFHLRFFLLCFTAQKILLHFKRPS